MQIHTPRKLLVIFVLDALERAAAAEANAKDETTNLDKEEAPPPPPADEKSEN